MKKILLLVLFFPFSAQALTYEVVGACTPTPVFSGSYEPSTKPVTVGKASIEIFERDSIPYDGAERGMHSILNTPQGEEAIEILNRRQMRVYGWCYSVNGVQPEKLADQFFLTGTEHLRWYYAYSYYDSGTWVSYCEPAYALKPQKFCP